MRSPVCVGSPPWSDDMTAPLLSSSGFLGRSTTSWSYVDHVIAIVHDKPPTACRQGHYSLVSPDTPHVVNCQGSRGIVRRSVVTSALTRRLSPVVRGQGALVEGWSGMSTLLCRPLSRGTGSWP
ncbi:hypothetical protein BHM03_00005656 [Ensete ventricosum]|uniref:Uncharacterized protein n=1 Tax=Ensete ventricosum TaxID=4639 RepID=A0A445MBB0_ENSVE|nr:hypothetical protein BHM03_00005656 [Ensete ventricosum]